MALGKIQMEALERVSDLNVQVTAMGVDFQELHREGLIVGQRNGDVDEDWNYYWRLTPQGEALLREYRMSQRIAELEASPESLIKERDNYKRINDDYEKTLDWIGSKLDLWFQDDIGEEVETVLAEYADACEENRELKIHVESLEDENRALRAYIQDSIKFLAYIDAKKKSIEVAP